jgi:hypothetical protein
MRLATLLFAVTATLSYPCFAAPRLPDYTVTEIGAPGAGQYVFCSPATCPEPTIKHFPDPPPPRAPEPAYSSVRVPAAVVAPAPVMARRSKRHRHGRKAQHDLNRPRSTTVLPRCSVAPNDTFEPLRFADR